MFGRTNIRPVKNGLNVSVGPKKLISEVAPNVAVDLFSQCILTSPNEQLIQSISESALSLGIFTFTKQISSKMSQISTIGSRDHADGVLSKRLQRRDLVTGPDSDLVTS